MKEIVQDNQIGDAAAVAVAQEDRRRAAKLQNVGMTRIPASLMGEDNSLLLRRAFEGAVVEAARRAAANYTLAVPQFYGGRIQLLLPLCLTGDKPELALTIQREDGFYAARTCLTLDMAYNNARLICRPETSWIKR